MDSYLFSIVLALFGTLLTLRVAQSLLSALNISLALNILTFLGAFSAARSDPEQKVLVFYVALGIFCVSVGAFMARLGLRYRPQCELLAFREQPLQSIFASNGVLTMALIFFFILGFGMVMLLFIRGGIPLFSEDVFVAKVQAAKQGGYLNVRFMRLFLPLLLIMFLVDYDLVKIRAKRVVLAGLIAFLIASFTLFGYRSYVLNYLAFPILLLLGYRKISRRLLMWIGIFSFIVALMVTAVAYRETNPLVVLKVIAQRLTADLVSGGLGVVVNTLVPKEGYSYGEGFWMDIPAALSRVGIGPPGLENSAQYVVTVAQGNNPYGWHAAPTLIGEGYANFGVGGIVILTFVFGFILESFHIITARGAKDTLLFPLKLYIQHALIIAFGSPFIFSLFDATMSLIVFCMILLCLYIGLSLSTGHVRFRPLHRKRRPKIFLCALSKDTPLSLS